MNSTEAVHAESAELVKAARAFRAAASQPGAHAAAPLYLAQTEEALTLLSGAWYQLAADAVPGITTRWRRRNTPDMASFQPEGLSHEQEVSLVATLHDVAAAFARCARACRDGRLVSTRVLTQREGSGNEGGGKQRVA